MREVAEGERSLIMCKGPIAFGSLSWRAGRPYLLSPFGASLPATKVERMVKLRAIGRPTPDATSSRRKVWPRGKSETLRARKRGGSSGTRAHVRRERHLVRPDAVNHCGGTLAVDHGASREGRAPPTLDATGKGDTGNAFTRRRGVDPCSTTPTRTKR